MKLLITLAPGLEYGEHADLLVVDWETRQIVDAFRYHHQFYKESHKGFAGAGWFGDRLLVSTEVELLEFDVAPLRLRRAKSFECFNDVHDVEASGNRIWVCNSGLDCVEEFDLGMNYLATHDLVRDFGALPRDIVRMLIQDAKRMWSRWKGSYEYYSYLTKRAGFRNLRKLIWPSCYHRTGADLRYTDFRPHYLHPNHVLVVGDDIWVTLFSSGKIVSLRSKKVLAEDLGRPHDGVISGDRYYITDCKNRRVIVYEFDADQRTLGRRIIAKELPISMCDGFVRGIAPIDGQLFVGLTAKRGTSVSQRFARIAVLSPETLDPLDQWKIPEQYGNAVFSILDATDHYQSRDGSPQCPS